ncbi:hypothetical protein MNBD_GAMMA06-1322 [hydrothermal vent metagenome]|uniref:SPOR domain-containing protein n=1 Tax=hydrothermal vent metagenome TaxID=652676 RepID=A0A3B0WIQ5_9ZZZZ
MAPILINSRDLLKIGIISTLLITFIFGGGFFMGYQQATTGSQVDNAIQSLPLPEESDALGSDILENAVESQVLSAGGTGGKMGVDQPEVLSKAVPSQIATQVNSNSKKKIVDPVKVSVFTPVLKKLPKKNEAAEKIENNPRRVTKVKTSQIVTDQVVADQAAIDQAATDQLKKIKYSIQVGVYVGLVNAKNMMKMLKVQQYDAYVSDFINKNNQTRYNVRVGYFANKKSALETLDKFKAEQKSDGYLVNFSAKSIVDTTDDDAIAVEKTVDAPAINDVPIPNNGINDEMKKAPFPVVPIDTAQDKISQADF